jgi:NADH:ubiquinone oxidoreductase subunit 2 (subunit N)
MLKLSTYGFIKYSIFLFPEASYYFTPLVHVLCVIGIIYSSFTTLRQIDIKKIIAYSSIGQNGPLNDILVYHPTQQTICGKFKISLISILKNTKIISSLILFLDSILVRNFLIYLNNPQITYTLSTLMEISEAICLLFTYILKKFKRISLISIYFCKKFYTTSTKKKDKAKKQFNE